jgi:hypothetical protein
MASRHAAPDRDRLPTFLTTIWAALHLAALTALGLAFQHQASTPADGGQRALAQPDTPPAV